VGGCGPDSSGLGQGPVSDFCKYGNNFSGFIKCREFLDNLSNSKFVVGWLVGWLVS
jgi:hypothetical protein